MVVYRDDKASVESEQKTEQKQASSDDPTKNNVSDDNRKRAVRRSELEAHDMPELTARQSRRIRVDNEIASVLHKHSSSTLT